MVRTLCFLVLVHSQMMMSGDHDFVRGNSPGKWNLAVRGTLFGAWYRNALVTVESLNSFGFTTKTKSVESRLILSSAPYKHAFVCTSSLITGVTLAMGISPLSPILLLTPASFWVGRYIAKERFIALHKNFYNFNEMATPATSQEIFDADRVRLEVFLQSFLLPICIGVAGVILVSRYQLKLPLR